MVVLLGYQHKTNETKEKLLNAIHGLMDHTRHQEYIFYISELCIKNSIVQLKYTIFGIVVKSTRAIFLSNSDNNS